MGGIGGGGVSNVGKPAEYYAPIDKKKLNSSNKAERGQNVNNFAKTLESKKVSSDNKTDFNNSSISRQEQIRRILDAQNKKNKDITNTPNKSDMDALIKVSGLSNDQIKELLINKNTKNNTSKSSLNNPKISDDKIGTNLALKRLAKEMEIQIMGMFYTLMDGARDIDPEGGFGEQIFRGEYLSEVVKSSSDKELGDIGLAIYRNLVKEEGVKKIKNAK